MEEYNLHLVSDSTGETVSAVSRAAMVQFDGIEIEEYTWSLIRTKRQVDKVLSSIKDNPGFVMYTIANPDLRRYLKENCKKMNIPCISILSRVIKDLSGFFGVESTQIKPGKQHEMNEEYFDRVEALNFAINHDDGQSTWDLEDADVVLLGVSRTSKSPTCVYLAHRGYRAANVPYVPGVPIPENVAKLKNALVVGLTISADRLVQIRKNRLLSLNEEKDTDYVNIETVKAEVAEARRFFNSNNWPIIDITRRSVEETAANIMSILQQKQNS